jgi:DMSO/TMAO reductase YedYZ molybdopterin-dependent catalytic subunit
VERPLSLSFRDLMKFGNPTLKLDVHCVTGWSVFDAEFTGVRVRELADRAGVKPSARYVIFEAAHGYTANVRLAEALAPEVLVAHRLDGTPLPREHGGPLRAVVPSLYFWKSAKWLTGIRFVARDQPGYWETRGYHNRADPWLEQRYA